MSQHPAFPAIVALWFAALFGLGSLVIPVTLIEQFVTATGIASILPPAAPPLGMTARLLIALVATLLGALGGMLIARRLARAHTPVRARRLASAIGARSPDGCRPINAHEELGDDGFDGADSGHFGLKAETKGGVRRRALAIAEDDSPSEFLDLAPLPGVDPARNPDPHGPMPDEQEFGEDDWQQDDDALELDGFDLSDPDDVGELTACDPALDHAEDTYGVVPEADVADRQEQILPDLTVDSDMPAFDAAGHCTTTEFDPSELPEASEPLSFAAPQDAHLARHEEEATMSLDAPEGGDASVEIDGEPDEEKETMQSDRACAADTATDDVAAHNAWASAPLDQLGLVQLAQRLGESIARHRERRITARADLAASPAQHTRVAPGAFEMAGADEASQAMAAFFGNGGADMAPKASVGDTPVHFRDTRTPESSDAGSADTETPDNGESDERQVFKASPMTEKTKAYQPFAGFAQLDPGDDDEDTKLDDLKASFSLPLDRKTNEAGRVPQSSGPAEEDGGAGDQEDTDFGSLLSLRNPFDERATEFVRIENEPAMHDAQPEPAVVFPHEETDRKRSATAEPNATAPASEAVSKQGRAFDPPSSPRTGSTTSPSPRLDAAEQEQALRDALLNLQRMSGSA